MRQPDRATDESCFVYLQSLFLLHAILQLMKEVRLNYRGLQVIYAILGPTDLTHSEVEKARDHHRVNWLKMSHPRKHLWRAMVNVLNRFFSLAPGYQTFTEVLYHQKERTLYFSYDAEYLHY